MSINSRIKERREALGLSRIELASMIGVTPSAIANYENGISSPKIELLYKLFDALKCDANYLYQDEMKELNKSDSLLLSKKEEDQIKKYRSLDSYGKKQVDSVLKNEYDRVCEQSMEVSEEPSPYIYAKTEYMTGLSAGTGLFVFDDIPTQIVDVPEEYKDADFVIGVSGESMMPTFADGDKVAVKKQNKINVGDIGVFMVDGNGFIKELGNGELISHNNKYGNIVIDENTICIGKVLGKV